MVCMASLVVIWLHISLRKETQLRRLECGSGIGTGCRSCVTIPMGIDSRSKPGPGTVRVQRQLRGCWMGVQREN